MPTPPTFTHWLVLELSEYFTLRNRGLLHALPASRYVPVAGATHRDWNHWYGELPTNWHAGRHFVVRATPPDAGKPLRFDAIDGTAFYALNPKPEKVAFLQERFQSIGPVVAELPFRRQIDEAREKIQHFPYGLVAVSLAEYELIEQPGAKGRISKHQMLTAEECLEQTAWQQVLPDAEDENQAVILRLEGPVASGETVPLASVRLRPVHPLTTRGADILRQEKSRMELATPWFESEVRAVLDVRRQAERSYNAGKLALLAGVDAKQNKTIAPIQEQLEKAWLLRQQRTGGGNHNPEARTFWDFLLDYDRTGTDALAISNGERGYLQDLRLVAKRFIESRIEPFGEMTDSKKAVTKPWSEVVRNEQLDQTAFRVFTRPTKQEQEALNVLTAALAVSGVQPLVVGFLYLRLRRELGDLEGEMTAESLENYRSYCAKHTTELAVALYALGLTLPFRRFVALHEQLAKLPLKKGATKSSKTEGASPRPSLSAKDTVRGDEMPKRIEQPMQLPQASAQLSLEGFMAGSGIEDGPSAEREVTFVISKPASSGGLIDTADTAAE